MESKNNIQDIYELSPMQQGMLFYSLRNPESGMYTVQFTCRLEGELDPVIFQQAWQRMVDRHTIFRTGFFWKEAEKPLQVVYRQVTLRVEEHDWREMSAAEQPAKLELFLEEDRLRGFEFGKAPLMRFHLVRMAERDYRFVWTYHHVLLDGWSLSQTLREFFTFYEVMRLQGDYTLEPCRPYRDYISWLMEQDQQRAEHFWRGQLQGVSAPTRLVEDRTVDDAVVGTMAHAETQIELSETTTAAMQAMVQKHQLTLNTLVQGAWAMTLARYSGESDVIFGTVVSGRPASLPGVESIVGPFINTLPLRVHWNARQPVLDWLKGLQAQQLEMREYEYTALVDIQGWSTIPRRQVMFETSVVFENYPVSASLQDQRLSLKVSGLRDIERTNYAMGLVAMPGPRLLLKLSYDANRFSEGLVQRMLRNLETALEGMAYHPEQLLGQVELLPAAERTKILVDWNQTEAPYSQGVPMHGLFERQVKKNPDAIAVAFENERVSYGELNARANRLAHALRELGVGPDMVVGICLERSVEMIVAPLAVLKAGAAYLPLDPTYPPARLGFMLEDAGVELILTQQALEAQLPAHRARLICFDRDAALLADKPESNPEVAVAMNSLAYIIYTSGSTGRPKGAAVSHSGVTNMIETFSEVCEVDATSQILFFSSFSFDIAVGEIFTALGNGSTLHVGTAEELRLGPVFAAFLREREISLVFLTPSVLAVIPEEEFPALRVVVSGGELCPASVVERLGHGRKFVNVYGPAETTVVCSYALVTPGSGVPPIGKPFANYRIYVLDEAMRPQPIGVAGELYLGGVGLGRGYWRRPSLTAEKFVPDPFSGEPGARLYRTGDLARFREDGMMEFAGRVDHQVKLRGFRIELGEIEAVLTQVPGVVAVTVMVREDVPGDPRLVAYYTASDPALEVSTMQAALRERVPEFMVPGIFILLEQFPLTANGKVDRKALPAPDQGRARGGVVVPPKNDMERILMEIWQAVLHLDQVSVEESFFDVGGHSLLMLQVNARAQKQLQREIPLVEMFQYPTIRALAQHLSGESSTAAMDQVQERVRKQREALQRQRMQQRSKGG